MDTETFRIEPGILCPKLVCGSAAWLEPGPRINGVLLPKQATLETFVRALQDPEVIIVGANIAYDIGVLTTELARMGFDAMPLVFAALEDGRFFDLQVAQALDAIAGGTLGKDPRTGGQLTNPETGRKGQYSLSACVDLVLGRTDSKANDDWRERYAELDQVPMEMWPAPARDYPIDDAKNSHECALAQCGVLPKIDPRHNWQEYQKSASPDGTPGGTYSACADCGATKMSTGCTKRAMHRNLHEVATQTYGNVALHLGAAWGLRVDQSSVDAIERYALRRRGRLIQPFVDAKILNLEDDGAYHEDQSVLKRMVAIAYGATEPCPHCRGTGKVPSPAAKPVRCPDCRGYCLPTAKDGPKCREWREAHLVASASDLAPSGTGAVGWHCATCTNTGLVPHPNPSMINCVIRGALKEDGDGKEREPDTKTCDGTGLVLPVAVPRSDKDGVSKGRDPLAESGDEFLMSYAAYLEDAKVLKDYVPYLRRARACVSCGQPGIDKAPHTANCPIAAMYAVTSADGIITVNAPSSCYRDIPLTLRPNSPLETGRVSYFGYIQLFPRRPGFLDKETNEYIPSLRECIVARGPQYELVEVPDGYRLQPGELVAQQGVAA